jgi:hypothetical protein
MDYGRGIVLRVRSSEQRVIHDRFSEICIGVSPPNPFIDRLLQIAAAYVHILPKLNEDHSNASILASRLHQLSGQSVVFEYSGKCLLALGRFFFLHGPLEGRDILRRELACNLHAKLMHCICYFGHINMPYVYATQTPYSSPARVGAPIPGSLLLIFLLQPPIPPALPAVPLPLRGRDT